MEIERNEFQEQIEAEGAKRATGDISVKDYHDMTTMQLPTNEQPQRMAIYFDRMDALLMVEALCLLRSKTQEERHWRDLSESQLRNLSEKIEAIERIKFYIDTSMPQGSE